MMSKCDNCSHYAGHGYCDIPMCIKPSPRKESKESDLVIRLLKENSELQDALKEATEWISCSKRTPDHKKDVLMMRFDGKIGVGNVRYGEHGDSVWHFLPSGNLAQVYQNNLQHGIKEDAITRWRPIDSPKAKEIIEKHQ